MLKDSFSDVITPFLGKRGLALQSILTPGVLIVIIFIVRLHVLKAVILDGILLAKVIAERSCTTAQQAAELALNAPAEAVAVANKMIVQAVEASVDAFLDSVSMLVSVIESLVIFALEMTIGTYACLTVSLVNIAANEALNATESVIKFSNHTVQAIANDLDDGLGKLTKLVNGAIGLIQDVTDFVTGGSSDLKNINLTVSSLRHVAIPGSINHRLEDIRTKIPTYNETKAAVENLIREPFQLISTRIDQVSLQEIGKMTPIKLPSSQAAPAREVCNITSLSHKFDEVYSVVTKVIIVMTVVCTLVAIVLCIWDAYRANSQFKRLETAATHTGNTLGNPGEKRLLQDKIDKVNAISYANDSYIVRKVLAVLERRIDPGPQRELWIWYVRFISHNHLAQLFLAGSAIFVLSILEYIVYKVLKSSEREIKALSKVAVMNMEAIVNTQYEEWTGSTNTEIARIESNINANALGWVKTGSSGLNTSLSTFMTKINDEVNKAFNNTPLQQPIAAVVQCVVGNKVDKIEEGLVWMHNRANVSLPRVPDAIFALNSTNSTLPFANSTLTKRTATHGLLNSTSVGNEAVQAFHYMLTMILQQIKSQAIIAGCFYCVWICFAFGALAHVLLQLRQCKKRSFSILPSPDSSKVAPLKLPPRSYHQESKGVLQSPKVDRARPPPSERVSFTQRMSSLFMGPSRRPIVHENIQVPHYVNYVSHDLDSPHTPLRVSFQ